MNESDQPAETPSPDAKVQSDRELLQQAQADGSTLTAYVRLSGPGWLQSAITLGGGSLAGALFLGVLGGNSMLWLQLLAITLGVIMLSAISYVTLSTGRRPFEAINNEINPVLGWGWLIATCMANIIWCMPQFSLCYDALDKNIFAIGAGQGLGDSPNTQYLVTGILFAAALAVVMLNVRRGRAAKWFDRFLKALIGMIVICFFGVVGLLALKGQLNLGEILAGFIPDFSQWSEPTGKLREISAGLPDQSRPFWTEKLAGAQRTVMIAAAATAVGINMTFLLPYSMLARGWDKPFRGLARFDLSTGMAIPYVLVTSCVVIASAASFHAKIDDKLASTDLATMQESPLYEKVEPDLLARIDDQLGEEKDSITLEQKQALIAALPKEEKSMAVALVKRNAFELSQTLSPLLGEKLSKLVFGLGVFGMGFSTIIILMLINGYAFREMLNKPNSVPVFATGVLVAGVAGASWFYFWKDPELKFYLAIYASTFGIMLLPVAYIAFFLMMNSRNILKEEKPTGGRMFIWNVLMGIAVLGALLAAGTAIRDKIKSDDQVTAAVVLTLLIGYIVAVAAGFLHKYCSDRDQDSKLA